MKALPITHKTAALSLSLIAMFTACNPATETSMQAGDSKQAAPAPPARAVCNDCGTVTDIEEVKEKGDAKGIGAVLGAAAGAVVGHQIGDGRGQDAATAAGAIGGGIAGHEVEKRINSTTYFNVTVNMESGGTQTAKVESLNGISVGSKVKVIGNNLQIAG